MTLLLKDAKVLVEKKYKKLPKKSVGMLMMVKNEKARLEVSLNSLISPKGAPYVDALIFYDTGSEDNTVDIIKNFSEKHKINLYLIEGEFVTFCISRNISLEYADTVKVEYILLMDCNDELKGGENLLNFVKYNETKGTAYFVMQHWWSGQHDKYYNIRLIKNKSGWRYKGSVHEYMVDTTIDSVGDKGAPTRDIIIKIPDTLNLYQDRTKDDDKTKNRFAKDRDLLLKDYNSNPEEPRTLAYLAQTYECLQDFSNAMYYSKLRLEQDGFIEEKYHAYMRCGKCAMALGHKWEDEMSWYLKAYDEFQRAEPLIKISDKYRMDHIKLMMEVNQTSDPQKKGELLMKGQQRIRSACMYAREACKLSYPKEALLFVDNGIYDYYRWFVYAICALCIGEHKEGKVACLIAFEKSLEASEIANDPAILVENKKLLESYNTL